MTADEMRGQKAALLLEHQEAQNECNHLLVRAKLAGALIVQFGQWMQSDPERYIFDQRQAKYDSNVEILPDKYRAAVDYQASLDLADQLRQAAQKLRSLTQYKDKLGLR